MLTNQYTNVWFKMNEGESEESMAAMAHWLKRNNVIAPVNSGLYQMSLVSEIGWCLQKIFSTTRRWVLNRAGIRFASRRKIILK
jgi:hypothetical protein